MAAIYQTGIDVSRYQGTIDWAAVARAGKQFAVIRAVSSNNSGVYVDPMFEKNYAGAKAAGLRVGVYYYTYAQTESYADRELEALTAVLAGKKLEYPVFVSPHWAGRGRRSLRSTHWKNCVRRGGIRACTPIPILRKTGWIWRSSVLIRFLWRITRAALPIRALTRCGSIPAQGVYRVYRAMWTWTIRMWIFCRPFRREATMAMNLRYPGWRWCRCPA